MRPRQYQIFFASGSKGNDVRADGNGSFLTRGYYFHDANGLQGPFANKRAAIRCSDASALYGYSAKQAKEARTTKEFRTVSCGCCTDGCVCWMHRRMTPASGPAGLAKCAYHAEVAHPHITGVEKRQPLSGKRPYCNTCGWRKGGVDSWNGTACKCGHTAEPIVLVEG